MRKQTLLLFCHLSQWERLPNLLEVRANTTGELHHIADRELRQWLRDQHYTKPDTRNRARLCNALAAYGDSLEGAAREYLQRWTTQ